MFLYLKNVVFRKLRWTDDFRREFLSYPYSYCVSITGKKKLLNAWLFFGGKGRKKTISFIITQQSFFTCSCILLQDYTLNSNANSCYSKPHIYTCPYMKVNYIILKPYFMHYEIEKKPKLGIRTISKSTHNSPGSLQKQSL